MTVFFKYSLSVVAFLYIGGSAVLAQTDAPQLNEKLNTEVEIYGYRSMVLKGANKMEVKPVLKESLLKSPTISYTTIPSKEDAEISPKPIPAAKISVEDALRKIYQGYIKAGFGLYTTPYLDFSYTAGRDRVKSWGVAASHLSSNGGMAIDDSIPSSFADNHFGIWGEKLVSKHAVSMSLDYDRNMVHRYGLNPIAPGEFDVDSLKSIYSGLKANVGLRSYHRDSTTVNYETALAYRYFANKGDEREHNVDVNAHLQKYIDSELFSLDLGVNYNQFNYFDQTEDKMLKKDNAIIKVQPMATIAHKDWNISVGMGIFIDARGDAPFHFYPVAQADYSLFEDLFVPYVGIGGNLKRNTYQLLASENPFVISTPQLKTTNNKFEVYGGIRGAISSKVSYTTRLARNSYDNFVYFINDTLSGNGNSFSVIYDRLAVTDLSAELALSSSDRLSFFLRGDYFFYGTGDEDFAWYQPHTKITANARYLLQEKFVVDLAVFQVGKRKARSLLSEDMRANGVEEFTTLKGYVDVNLAVEYRYTRRISAWVKMNNLLAVRYQQWNGYPVQRFQAMMGVSYAF